MKMTFHAIQQADAISQQARNLTTCTCGYQARHLVRWDCDRCEQACCGCCSEIEWDEHDGDRAVRICHGCFSAWWQEQGRRPIEVLQAEHRAKMESLKRMKESPMFNLEDYRQYLATNAPINSSFSIHTITSSVEVSPFDAAEHHDAQEREAEREDAGEDLLKQQCDVGERPGQSPAAVQADRGPLPFFGT